MKLKNGQLVRVQESKQEGPVQVRVDQVSQSGQWFSGFREDTPQANSTWYHMRNIVTEE